MSFKKSAVLVAVVGACTLDLPAAQAVQLSAYAPVASIDNNLTFLDPTGSLLQGTNDVAFAWDGTIFTSSGDYTGPGGSSNATLSSPTPFFGYVWTAHDIQIFGPGTYSFDTTLGGGSSEFGTLSMNVGVNQLGAHLLWDWNGKVHMDMAMVWGINTVFFGDLWMGPSNPSGNNAGTLWMLASADGNGDGINGIPMTSGGAFDGYNFNFNIKGSLSAVPLPPAIWLFGTGLLSLVGLMRRRTNIVLT